MQLLTMALGSEIMAHGSWLNFLQLIVERFKRIVIMYVQYGRWENVCTWNGIISNIPENQFHLLIFVERFRYREEKVREKDHAR
jgi:hypothetical protein